MDESVKGWTPSMREAPVRGGAAAPRLAAPLFATVGLVTTLACGGARDATAPGRMLDLEHGYWALRTNHQALLMSTVAPYDTIRLAALPLNGEGVPLPGAVRDSAMTTYTLADPTDTNVTISRDGLIRVRHPEITSITVRTSLQGIIRTTVVPLAVTAVSAPPRAERLSLQITPIPTLPIDWDTLGGARFLIAQALDASGTPIANVPFAFRSSDTMMVKVDATGMATQSTGDIRTVGPVMVYAAATVYGVPLADSARLVVTPPSVHSLVPITFRTPRGSTTPVGYFGIPTDTVAVGVVIQWFNGGGPTQDMPIDVVFDNPAAAQAIPDNSLLSFLNCDEAGVSGNIAAFRPDTTKVCGNFWRVRMFTTPGTYPYHSELYHSSGVIVVVP